MVYIVCYLLSIAFFSYTEAQQLQSNISQGSALTPATTNSSWPSRSGMYAFGFYKEGNGFAVGIVVAGVPQKTVVWTANRDGGLVSDNASLLFTSDGIALQSTQGRSLVVASPVPVVSASMLDSGNFVLYNASRVIVWQSFEYPTDTLLPNQPLRSGPGVASKELLSAKSETDHSSGTFRLAMQGDGNLVQYPVDTGTDGGIQYAYYATNTDKAGTNSSLNLGVDGRLYLLNGTGGYLLNLTDGGLPIQGKTYLMRIDTDGIFRLYSYDLEQKGNWSIEWPLSPNRCAPLGICGLNSYCITMGATIDCRCLPGFVSVNPRDERSGCERNSSVGDVCKSKNWNCNYTMEELTGTRWEDQPYNTLSSSDKEYCIHACLEDLNCQAAVFDGSRCRKQRLPLRYGRTSSSTSIVLIKGAVMSSIAHSPDAVVPKGSRKNGRDVFFIIGMSFTALGSIFLVISVIVLRKHNVWAYKRMHELNGDAEWNEDMAPRPYAYEDLENMTNNFNDEVGRGASGTVYKGVIGNSQRLVAVKRLEKIAAEGDKEFQTEMKAIGRTHHRNLVRLRGYCLDGAKKLLVYEFMSNGSLADILFTAEKKPNWEERMGIARNIARGFLYLHEECDTQIIHCDIKPQNILMDEYMCPKISDFGLAKLLQQDQTRTTTGIRGTKGYVAPEWHRKMPITVKADVYSFGIVLLEIVCCRRNVDWTLPEEEGILDELVYHYFENGELRKLVGDEDIDRRQLERVVKVGLWCIQDEPSLRPSMRKVLLMLEGTIDIPTPPNPSSFLNTI